MAASSRQFPGRLASVRDRGTPVRRLQVTPAAPPAPPVAVPAPASSLSPSNAEKVKTRRVAADQRDATARKAVWEKCHGTTSTHLQKLQVNNKIREIAKDSNCRLERPWLQFEDYARTALVTEVQQHPEVGAKYGLTKADCTLLIKTICRDYCRNRGASERRRVRRSEAADPSEGGLRPRESGDDLFLGREEDDGYLSLGARSQLMASIVAAASGL